MKKFSLFCLTVLAMFIFAACQSEVPGEKVAAGGNSYEVISRQENIPQEEASLMVDVVALLESRPESEISEFTSGPWAVAVKNLDSGYTYYYDSSNNFLGRKK
jgi:hypothetical protein